MNTIDLIGLMKLKIFLINVSEDNIDKTNYQMDHDDHDNTDMMDESNFNEDDGKKGGREKWPCYQNVVNSRLRKKYTYEYLESKFINKNIRIKVLSVIRFTT